MAIVKDHSTGKRKQLLWEFPRKFPNSIEIEEWLFEQGIYAKSRKCPAGIPMTKMLIKKKEDQKQLVWKYTHRPMATCRRAQKSIRDGSIFLRLKDWHAPRETYHKNSIIREQ
ncbi:predicted protein [Lichtheimia corymbifera JMRC:FSU:9682]|uniref:Uncharacterized protein n=1 Tax=Lichtheimia corymbifera JMRC:FSU:9682 TaxID=1263082 RepID=A0A068SGM9_9FUNG|nr:predicted protein [Lichtheimia corymbifera JMRC:FSU:9682]